MRNVCYSPIDILKQKCQLTMCVIKLLNAKILSYYIYFSSPIGNTYENINMN